MFVEYTCQKEKKKKQQQKTVDYHLNKRPNGNKAKNDKKKQLTDERLQYI